MTGSELRCRSTVGDVKLKGATFVRLMETLVESMIWGRGIRGCEGQLRLASRNVQMWATRIF